MCNITTIAEHCIGIDPENPENVSFYPESICEVLENLRHCNLLAADAAFTASDFECGTCVRFSLAIDPSSRTIAGIAFKTNACGYGVAAAEVLSLELSGRSLEELGGLKEDVLSEILSSRLAKLPRDRAHCVDTAIEALQGAFAEYRRRQLESYNGDDPLICTCFGVSETAIMDAIERDHLRSVREVSGVCRAGLGCGSCRMLIQEIIDDVASR